MFRKLAYLLIVGCLFCVQAQAADGLVAYWSLNDGAGDTAVDSTGNGYDGVLTGGPAWVAGQLGGALDFSGGNSFVAAPHIPLDNRSFTVAFWTNMNQNTAEHVAFGQHQAGSSSLSLHIRLGGTGNPPTGGINMGFYSNDCVTEGGLLDLNVWYHIACVYDIDAEQQRIFLNGEMVDEETATPFLATSGDTRIGQWNNNGWFDGIIDDVQVYHNALTQGEVQSIMAGLGNPNMATAPNPADGATDVIRDSDFSWIPGETTGQHNLYLGENIEDVNSMTVPTASLDANSFDPGRLEFDKTYAWRVDEVNSTPDKTVFKGDIWSFTAEPYSIQIPGVDINATASSSSNDFSLPEKAIDGSGLSESGAHNIASEAMWFTEMNDPTPWIQFEFDNVKKLDTMKVWNSNSSAEGFIGYGVNNVQIEYSTDGEIWNLFEDVNTFSRAPGAPTYDQYDTVVLGGVAAKMVRLNIQSNFGGFLKSYSLSEVQFSAIPVAARTPKPASGSVDILPDAVASWRAGREAAQSTVYVGTDPNEVADGLAPSATSNSDSIDLSSFDLQMGETYYWRVDEVNDAEADSVWAGPVWSFSTVAAVVFEDFESYGNDSPDRPFQTWLDGYGYSADEFFSTGYNGNGTGAGIGHDIWSVASSHYNGDIMETANTMPGSGQSMPFYYGNSGNVASQTERTFAVAQDWTIGGAQTLSIAFNGQTGNTGTLYVKINNTKLTYPRAASNIALGAWQAWNIDLTSMNVQNVTTLQIGVDGSSASGMILIDDIRLHAEAGEMITPAAPGPDGLVAHYTFDEGAGAVVGDSSGSGNNGTVMGSPQWIAGKVGGAMQFSGVDDYVDCGNDDSLKIQDAVTVACWIKVAAFSVTWETIVSMGDDSYRLARGPGDGDSAHFGCNGPTGGNISGNSIITTDTWRHVVGVYDGAHSILYIDGFENTRVASTGQIDVSAHNLFIAENAQATGRLFGGAVDDVRIYNRPLSPEEVAGLAGITTPIDKPF